MKVSSNDSGKPYRLLRRFAIASFLSIAVATAVITWVDYRLELDEHVEIGELKNTALAQSMLYDLWEVYAPLLFEPDLDEQARQASVERLAGAVGRRIAGTDVIKVRMYSPLGAIVFSTDAAEIGRVEEFHAGLVQALGGSVNTNVEAHEPHEGGHDEWRSSNLIETYLPLRSTPDGNVAGVLEVYADNARNLASRHADVMITGSVVAGTMLVLYAALFLIVRRADATIRAQDAERGRYLHELQLAKHGLEERVEERTTQLRETNRALVQSEERFRSIATSAREAILVANADGVVTYGNPAGDRLFGFDEQALIGQQVERLIGSVDVAPDPGAGLDGAPDATGGVVRVSAYRGDGTSFPAEISVSELKQSGAGATLYIVRDVTERARAEEKRAELEAQLRQAQRMEAMGRLTGGVAHDFNNFLAAIMGYTEVSVRECERDGSTRVAGYLREALRAVERARDLVRQLLTFSRREPTRREPASLAATAHRALKLVHSTLPSSIDVRTNFDYRCPQVLLDGGQLERVIMNLCLNARDAVAGAGCIQLAVRTVQYQRAVCESCRMSVVGDFVELSISDDGSGIDPAFLENAFDPFVTTKPEGSGTGMGLALAHGIVHEHDGHILVESVPGDGTTFRLLFPPYHAVREATGPDTAPREDRDLSVSGRVLVVDDDAAVAGSMSLLLESAGAEVTSFTRSEAALAHFLDDPQAVDLVISDQTMPSLTGMELAHAMLRVRPGLPILLCTGYGAEVAEESLAQIGVRALLRKPVPGDELLRLVRSTLAESAPVSRLRLVRGRKID